MDTSEDDSIADPEEAILAGEFLGLIRKHPETLRSLSLKQALLLEIEEWIDLIEQQETFTFILPGVRAIDISVSATQPIRFRGVYQKCSSGDAGNQQIPPLDFESRSDLLQFFPGGKRSIEYRVR